MSECARWEKHYLDYAEGILRGRKLEEMERHLAACERCTGAISSLATLSQATKQLAPAEPRAKLDERILERVSEMRRRGVRPVGWRVYETVVLRPLHSPLTVIAAAWLSGVAILGIVVHGLVVNPEVASHGLELLSNAASSVGGWAVLGAMVVAAIFVGFDLLGLAAAPLLLKCARCHKEAC